MLEYWGTIDTGILQDTMKPKLNAYLERLRKFKPGAGTKTAVGGMGVAGIVGASQEAYSEELERSGSKPLAVTAGAVKGAYEALETPLMMGMSVGDAGAKGISDEPSFIPGRGAIETPFTRSQTIEALDKRQATINEQQARIRAYDKRQRSLEDQTNELLQLGEK